MTLRVVPVPCLNDNYAYLVLAPSGHAAVVDPSEAEPVRKALAREGATLAAIWATHHHLDHVGGIEGLLERTPHVPVLGSRYDLEHGRIPGQTRALEDGERFAFEGHEVLAMTVPGHTLGAIAYLVDGHLFSGDTLFLAGCGRVFEGTMPMMAASMKKLRALDPGTHVWCGHEYTVSNLRFARTVEPANETIEVALREAEATRAAGRPTVPGTLAVELTTNPFLRFDRPDVAAGRDPVASFTAIREAKNRF